MKRILWIVLAIVLLFTNVSFAQVYLWRYRVHATDCTAYTDGKPRDLCFEQDDQKLYKCDPTAGDCDTAGEWKVILASADLSGVVPYAGATTNVDLGVYGLTTSALSADYLQLNTLYSDGVSEGRIQWNADDGVPEVGMPGGKVNGQILQEMLFRTNNDEGSVIDNGTPVLINGASGNRLTVRLPDITSATDSFAIIGLATEDLSVAQGGYITTKGFVRGDATQPIDTSGFLEGAGVFIGDSGALSATPATKPNRTVFVGIVKKVHASEGEIWVNIIHLPMMTELSDISLSSITDNDILYWDSATSLWKNKTADNWDTAYGWGDHSVQNYYDKDTDSLDNIAEGTSNFYIYDLVNGSFRESFNALVTSDGATITLSVEQSGGGDLTMQFSDGLTTLDTTPAGTITLTAGTDAAPQSNYVYIPQSTKVLTKSTTGFPTDAEHIKIGYFFVPSASHVQSDGVYINQNWNDHLMNSDNQGHLTHLGEKIRRGLNGYFSGLAGDGDGGTYVVRTDAAPDTVYLKMASGVVYQMHRQAVAAKDTSVSDDFHIVNSSVSAYEQGTDLYNFLVDADGDSMSGKYYNLVLWIVANKTGEYAPLMVNLPTCSYSLQTNAEQDTNSCDVYDIPREFRLESGTGYLLARLTMKHSVPNDLELISTVDLRGTNPSSVTGGANTTHDPTTLAGTPDYLTIAGQEITMTVLNDDDVSDAITVNPINATTETAIESAVEHDDLQGFVANEHIDWTNANDDFKTTANVEGGTGNFGTSATPEGIFQINQVGTATNPLSPNSAGFTLAPTGVASTNPRYRILATYAPGSTLLSGNLNRLANGYYQSDNPAKGYVGIVQSYYSGNGFLGIWADQATAGEFIPDYRVIIGYNNIQARNPLWVWGNNNYLSFGDAEEVQTSWDGSNWIFDAQSSGNFSFRNGYVGIGIDNPTEFLQVQNDTATDFTKMTIRNQSSGVSAGSAIDVLNDQSALLSLLSHSSARTLSRCGITMGNWAEIFAASAYDGLLIDTQGADPLVFGVNNIEVMRLTTTSNVDISSDVQVDGTLTSSTDIVIGVNSVCQSDGTNCPADDTGTDDQTIDVFSISGNNIQLSLESDGEATKTVDVSTTTAVTANTAKVTESTTAGRSLTLSTYSVEADTELYTDTKCMYWEDPVATDDFNSIWTANGFAATITKMWCESDQTVNLDLQVDDGTPADVNGTDLVCDSTPAEDESMGGDATVADGDRVDMAVTSVSGTPTWVSVCFTYTKDD